MPAGRPSEYDPERTSRVAKVLCMLGAIDKDLAEAFGVSEQTINTWKAIYPEFLESLKEDKTVADAEVVASHYKRCLGYEVEERTTIIKQRAVKVKGAPVEEDEWVEYDREVRIAQRHIPPSDTAIIFWEKNRDPERWRDVHHFEDSGLAGILANLEKVEKEEKEAKKRQPKKGAKK